MIVFVLEPVYHSIILLLLLLYCCCDLFLTRCNNKRRVAILEVDGLELMLRHNTLVVP
jgi:hypothetical protein